jgi:lipoate---protein ligase
MEIGLLDRTLPTLAENLALDEALLLDAEAGAGGEALRFWEWPDPAVVLGAGCSVKADVDEQACERDGVPIHRRASGGGTVLLGDGCLIFSLVLRFDRVPALKDVNASYRHILGRMCHALQSAGTIEMSGISDLAISGRKCSGNSQQRKRDHLLHHGTLLYRFDIGLISRYLQMPDKQPAYRESRAHERFVTNLPATEDLLKALIATEWQATRTLATFPIARTAELVVDKYSQDEWNKRR